MGGEMSKTKGFGFILGLLLLACYCEDKDIGYGVAPPSPDYPEIDQSPSWSPDGSTIVYYHNGTVKVDPCGSYEVNLDSVGLYFISPTGDNRRMFLKGENRLPAWSPDGKWIAFVNQAQIYKITVNGDSLTQLTFKGRNYFPAWSPDGKWIAYDSNVDNPGGGYSIWIMDSDGNNKRMLAPGRMADWSPDGKYLIFVGFHCEIYRVSVEDTSKVEKLTFLNQDDIYATENKRPVYSPDGKKIAFESNCQIWVMDADGGNLKQLTQEGGTSPAWSPDGKYIVYTRYNYAEFSDENGHLWIMDSDGKNKRQLTFRWSG